MDGATNFQWNVHMSRLQLEEFPESIDGEEVRRLMLSHNFISIIPRSIEQFKNLIELDVSSNRLKYISDEITSLSRLKKFTAKNNLLDNESFPKELGKCQQLEVVNLSGNQLTEFPMELTKILTLRELYLGGNHIGNLPVELDNLQNLEILYLGGNQLVEIPATLGNLASLTSLGLSDNKLKQLPSELAKLKNLQSLSLHNNLLTTLPPQIIKLKYLGELSLRGNPLVMRFCRDLTYQPPSLLELAGRVIKTKGIAYREEDLPTSLIRYLSSACKCVNPKCKGVYFESRVENVKFVDFCGKYRLPLLQYLCSPNCAGPSPIFSSSSDSELSEDDEQVPVSRIKKVLLG
ncbi:leucine-rich repeat-containing protein 58-like [Ptychodera flava]|uniref:leucine-rich repeat-containing protein 58-like n=1 Tax=Ptychodera flava TaxID=63121 RepID=UPI00396A7AE1